MTRSPIRFMSCIIKIITQPRLYDDVLQGLAFWNEHS